ncbi:hypothetical protein C8R44DRAFT_862557 [Mycena epipterygia]|nr:hypothetical protein C8R44DRAFT_862557 [Mycena epipterygia]
MDSSEYFDFTSGKFPDDEAYISDSDYTSYSLNLGADSPLDTPSTSMCPTPRISGTPQTLRPALRLQIDESSSSSTPALSACPSLSATSSSMSAWSPHTPFSDDEDFPAHTLHSSSVQLHAQSYPDDLHRDSSKSYYSQLGVQLNDADPDMCVKEGERLSISQSSILGPRSVLLALVRAAGCVIFVALLAGSARWGGGSWAADSERNR